MCKDGKIPTMNEMRYAICAMDSLMIFDRMAFSDLRRGKIENKKPTLIYNAEFQYSERFDRLKRAYSKSPKMWLGDSNDPDSKDVQDRRKISNKIVERILNKNKPDFL